MVIEYKVDLHYIDLWPDSRIHSDYFMAIWVGGYCHMNNWKIHCISKENGSIGEGAEYFVVHFLIVGQFALFI